LEDLGAGLEAGALEPGGGGVDPPAGPAATSEAAQTALRMRRLIRFLIVGKPRAL
jgi:hypothetical protein